MTTFFIPMRYQKLHLLVGRNMWDPRLCEFCFQGMTHNIKENTPDPQNMQSLELM